MKPKKTEAGLRVSEDGSRVTMTVDIVFIDPLFSDKMAKAISEEISKVMIKNIRGSK